MSRTDAARRRPLLSLVGPSALAALVGAACGSTVTTQEGDDEIDDGASSIVTSVGATTGGVTTGPTSGATSGAGGEGGAGGSGGAGGDAPAPPFRSPVDLPDEELALRALQLLGADVEGAEDGCVPCHSLTESKLRIWEQTTNAALDGCLTDLSVSSREIAEGMLTCIRDASGLPGDKFATHTLGFWSAGADRDWWRYTFEKAYPADGTARWETFVGQVKMPPAEQTLTEGEIDLVAEWFVRGAPLLDELLDEDPPPGECDALVTGAVGEHVAAMATEGWRAENASSGMLMYGCAGAETPRDCLADELDADPAWSVPGQGVLKRLHATSYPSSYWTRSSTSGRYVAHGVWDFGMTAAIVDLQEGATIPVGALFDPAFFPDDQGFVFQGGERNVCGISVLAGPPAQVSMSEPACKYLGEVGLYQHVGAALGGGDYFAVSGPFVSDDGGHDVTLENPWSDFGQSSSAFLTPMIFTGSAFSAKPSIEISTPLEGDAVLSPSAGLLMSRVSGPNGRQNGMSLRRVIATPDGDGSYDVEVPQIGRYCIDGGKPAFSFDERWLVLHHYVEDTDADAQALGFVNRTDPGFQPFRQQGAANVLLVDLPTGEVRRITSMPPGKYALFPHFRSDGWIYFIVRTAGLQTELVLASDAALAAEGL